MFPADPCLPHPLSPLHSSYQNTLHSPLHSSLLLLLYSIWSHYWLFNQNAQVSKKISGIETSIQFHTELLWDFQINLTNFWILPKLTECLQIQPSKYSNFRAYPQEQWWLCCSVLAATVSFTSPPLCTEWRVLIWRMAQDYKTLLTTTYIGSTHGIYESRDS